MNRRGNIPVLDAALASVWSFLLCVISSVASAHSSLPSRFDLGSGPHAVGLKIVEQYDYSRMYRSSLDAFGKPYPGERARPLQTLVWYPAERGGGTSLTVRDYLDLWATETSFDTPRTSLAIQDWVDGMSPALETHLLALRNAKPALGRYPVVIYAPGGSQVSWDNADLCEYLASFGYVVIASPSIGRDSRSMTYDVKGANTQAADIRFLINYARTLPDVMLGSVAVVGDSWGAMAALFAAARDQRIAALVALDGSMRYYPGLITMTGDVNPERMSIPLIYFMEGYYSLEDREQSKDPLRNGPTFLLQWTHGDLIVAHMLGLAHASFCSMWQRREDWWSASAAGHRQPADYGREDAMTGYAWVVRYTLKFLDTYLKHDPEALKFLKSAPADNGVPQHVMSVSVHVGTGAAHSYEDFRAGIGREGLDHAQEVYAALQKEDSKFFLDEDALTDWADELLSDGHAGEAIALLRFNEQIHADSSQAEATLGDAYRLSGNAALAVEAYRRAIAKEPSDRFVADKLRALTHEKVTR